MYICWMKTIQWHNVLFYAPGTPNSVTSKAYQMKTIQCHNVLFYATVADTLTL